MDGFSDPTLRTSCRKRGSDVLDRGSRSRRGETGRTAICRRYNICCIKVPGIAPAWEGQILLIKRIQLIMHDEA